MVARESPAQPPNVSDHQLLVTSALHKYDSSAGITITITRARTRTGTPLCRLISLLDTFGPLLPTQMLRQLTRSMVVRSYK